MKISIVDPGLISKAGHHLDLDLRVVEIMKKMGHEVTVYSNEKIDSETSAKVRTQAELKPLLKLSPYFGQGYSGEMFFFRHQVSVMASDLKLLPRSDLFLFPSLFVEQLCALSALPAEQKVFGCIHLPPKWPAVKNSEIWEKVLNASNRSDANTRIGVFEPELLLEYECLLNRGDLSINKFPVPFGGERIGSPRRKLDKVAILGHQRGGKGDNLHEIVRLFAANGYELVLNDSSGKISLPKDQVGRVTVLGYVDDLNSLIADVDAVVLPYDKQFYRFNGSGIAWEAISAGVPIVAPGGTSVSRIIHQYGNGVRFFSGQPMGILKALNELRDGYDVIARRSYDASEEWSRVNGIDLFGECVDRFANNA